MATASARMNPQKLSRSFYPFLIMISCFSMVSNILGTFLSTYTLAATGSAENVKIFNIILALCQPFAMVAAIFVVRRISAIRSQQVGLGLIMLVNFYLFIFVEKAAGHIFLISALQSVANGFYYTTYACQFVNYTTNDNRDKSSGIMNVVLGTLSLIFTLGSSLLFTFCPGEDGYRIIFLLALIFSACALIFSVRLAPLTTVSSDHTMYYIHAHKVLWKNPWARNSMWISAIEGVRTGLLAFFLNILLYGMVKSESLIAFSNFLASVCSIAAAGIYARVMRTDKRYRSAQLSILGMIAATLGLFFMMNPTGIILYSAINACLLPFYATPLSNAYWTVLEKLPELDCCRPETHAAREVYYAFGRIAGTALTLLLPATNLGSVLVLLFMMAIQYLGLRLSRGIMRDLDKAAL